MIEVLSDQDLIPQIPFATPKNPLTEAKRVTHRPRTLSHHWQKTLHTSSKTSSSVRPVLFGTWKP